LKGYSELNNEEASCFADMPRRLTKLAGELWTMKLNPASLNPGRSRGLGRRLIEGLTQLRDLSNKMDGNKQSVTDNRSSFGAEKSKDLAAQKARIQAAEMAESKGIMAKIAFQRSCGGVLDDYKSNHSLMQVWPRPDTPDGMLSFVICQPRAC
jgi:hypothetical protein